MAYKVFWAVGSCFCCPEVSSSGTAARTGVGRRGVSTMSWTPEVLFFVVVSQPMILSTVSQDALWSSDTCCGCSGVLLGKMHPPLCHLNAGCGVNAPGQPVLYNGVVGDAPGTDPAAEGHEGHNHVPPPCLSGVEDEIVFSTPTLRCCFRLLLGLFLREVVCLDRLLSPNRFCCL